MNASTIFKRLVPLGYFLLVSLPHHYVTNLFEKYLLIPFGMGAVQSYADFVSIALLFGVVVLAVRLFLLRRSTSWKQLLAWLATIALMFIADRYLIVNNIERIHFPQYAILAILLAWTVRDDVLVFFVSCFAGAIDEFMQFVSNPNHTNYLDFNDIVLNILGAALGVFIVLGLIRKGFDNQTSYEKKIKLFSSITLAALTFVIGFSVLLGRVVMFADVPKGDRHVFAAIDGKLSFILSFQSSGDFWIVADNGKQFNTLTVYEGLALVIALLIFYRWAILWLDQGRVAIDSRHQELKPS